MATRNKPRPKQVVYLWGAGATQAEAQHLGATISLLMRDTPDFGEGITTRTLNRTGRRPTSAFGSEHGVDIEKLISLLAASGIDEHTQLAEKFRKNYFNELRASLTTTEVRDNPQLAIRLLQLHRDRKFQEEVETLSGIITTNHDGLLQVASQSVFQGINIGFKFASEHFTQANSNSVPPILQLHGSFTWRFDMPITVARIRRTSKYPDTVWIPPTILKESKSYPFNKLSGLAYELLARHCDVLRVVGASLTQNDWNILSLIFNAQRHREATKGTAFLIELIMPHKHGEIIIRECGYLKSMNPIGYLTEGKFGEYIEKYEKNEEIQPDSDLANPFAYWLNEKTQHHRSRSELSVNGADEETGLAVGEDT